MLFCHYFDFTAVPASIDTICLYAQFLSRTFKSTDSISNYINGVRLLHLYNDSPFPHFGSLFLKLTLRGIARLHPHLPKQALPITPEILLKMSKFFNMEIARDATFWCLFLLAFFFNESEIKPSFYLENEF